ncbi:TonB-dependent siderophore receptor [Microbulbifer sp. THAF38]|uniref:TonB-dependent receptor plug domain-containing protein n=1 Tax=Microbulbifer sp. THAF38 TaxID=2587856 RepID=UPI0012695221|nr:TonB-dependent receptor [Microbulbifer sp. THAF38]QFT56431.1 Colicin I receptor precursor [Microbulbifer sp. THAF38]
MKKTLLAAAVFAAAQPLLSVAADLEEITVTASRLDLPKSQLGVSVSILNAADIERLGYTSLLDVMRTLPGVAVSNSGGAGKVSSLFIRGESNFRTLVLLDGVNIADPTGLQVSTQLQHLQASDIERIEVLRGPQGMLYGAGAGGVINIISKRSTESVNASASVEAGRYGSQSANANLGGSIESWYYDLNVSDYSTDGFNATENDTSGEEDGYDNLTASARLGYQVNENLSLEGQYRKVDTETEYDNCFSDFPNDCLSRFDQEFYIFSSNYQFANWNHRVSLSQQEIDREEGLSPGAFPFITSGEIREANYIGSHTLSSGKLLWGGEYEQQKYATQFAGVTSGDEVLESTGLFTEWHSDFAEKVFYTLGYRRDSLEVENHNSWRVSAALPVSLGEDHQLKYRANFGTGYRAPSPYEYTTNASLGAETSRGYELGLEYQWAQLLQAELTYFDQEINDAIFYNYITWSFEQDNGESQSEGVELSLGGNLNGSLDWSITGTWLNSEDFTGAQRGGVPQRVFNFGLSQQWLGDKLTLSGNWQRVEDRIDGYTRIALENYSKVDLNAVYRVSPNMRVNLRGENVLDRNYREVAGYYTAGAAVYAGIEFSL